MKIKYDEKGHIGEIWFGCEISIDNQQYHCVELERPWGSNPSVTRMPSEQGAELLRDGPIKSAFKLNGLEYDPDMQLISCQMFKSSRFVKHLCTEDILIRKVKFEDKTYTESFYLFDNKIPAVLLKDLKETGEIDINLMGCIRTHTNEGRFDDMPCILHLHCTAYQLSSTDEMLSFEDVYSIVTSLEPVEEVKEE